MSAVEIVCVSASALALVLAVSLLLSGRAHRRRTADLQATIDALTDRVESVTTPPTPEPTVHLLEPLPVAEQAPEIVTPTTAQVVDATLGRPVVRAVTLGHGVRRALRPESRDRIAALVRREFRRRRKLRMKAGRRAARLAVVPPAVPEPEDRERAS
jgi:hypothetical protein